MTTTTVRPLTDLDRYYLARDADEIAKFLAKHATWSRRIAAHRLDPEANEFPNPRTRPSETAKGRAYDAAGRIARLLEMDFRAGDVPGLARAYGLAIDAYNHARHA